MVLCISTLCTGSLIWCWNFQMCVACKLWRTTDVNFWGRKSLPTPKCVLCTRRLEFSQCNIKHNVWNWFIQISVRHSDRTNNSWSTLALYVLRSSLVATLQKRYIDYMRDSIRDDFEMVELNAAIELSWEIKRTPCPCFPIIWKFGFPSLKA